MEIAVTQASNCVIQSVGINRMISPSDADDLGCVAVDCIALNYWGKHKRKMVVRGINWQATNQQQ